ncbi:MAG: response regulator [Piscirickettsiaceae bacterium]|nr:response regulator [Piscirickettsiaceae bacterium]
MPSINISELAILLIEPSTMQRKIIQSHLQEEGVNNVEGASTGEEALKFMKQYPPDLVISAMYLPDMSATDLITTMRNSDTLQDINFMLVSSETRFKALDPIRQAGVTAILPKPFDHQDLKNALITTVDYLDTNELELENYEVTELQVLVVDDSLTARNQIKRILTNMGIQYLTLAKNGLEAIDKLRETHFDLIVTDLNMPEMDGLELIEYIRKDMNDSFIPILMVSSENDETRLSNVQQAGVSAICDKPFDPHSIRTILRRILDE